VRAGSAVVGEGKTDGAEVGETFATTAVDTTISVGLGSMVGVAVGGWSEGVGAVVVWPTVGLGEGVAIGLGVGLRATVGATVGADALANKAMTNRSSKAG
jgi:hypothetical protein